MPGPVIKTTRDFSGIRRSMQLSDPPQFRLSEKIVPVYDLSNMVWPDQIEHTTQTIVAASGDILTTVTVPAGTEWIIRRLYVGLTVARGMYVSMFDPGQSIEVLLYDTTTAATNHTPTNNTGPIKVPPSFIIGILIRSMLIGDGNGFFRMNRLARPRDASVLS